MYDQLYQALSGGVRPNGNDYVGCEQAWEEKEEACYNLVYAADLDPTLYPALIFQVRAPDFCSAPVINVDYEVVVNGVINKETQKVTCSADGIEAAIDELPHAEVYPEPVPITTASIYTATQSQPGAVVSASTHMCAFSGVRGSFESTNQVARVNHTGGANPDWLFEVINPNYDVGKRISSSMICSPLTNFRDVFSTPSTPPVMLAEQSTLSVTAPSGSYATNDLSSNLANGDKTLLAVSGMAGNFAGGAESVNAGNDLGTPREWEVGANDGKTVVGMVLEVGVSEPYSDERQYAGVLLPGGSLNVTREFSFNTETAGSYWTIGPKESKLIPVEKGVCFVTEVSGAFDGTGESVRLSRKDGFWHVRIDAACESTGSAWATDDCEVHKRVEVNVVCLQYDQSVQGD